MDIAVLLGVLAALFLAIGLTGPLAERLRLPDTVVLAAIGIALGAGATSLWLNQEINALNPLALAILQLPISSEVFLYVFLPTLIFEVALTINLRRMLDDWVVILCLAVVAVLVATMMIGFALSQVTTLPVIACLLIGAIVSTTDPSAVVSIFRATPAPQRLARIVEGESLLNDAAAIALFAVFLSDVVLRADTPDVSAALLRFPGLVLMGAAVGVILGRLAVWLMARLNAWPLGQVSVSLAVPYATFLLADKVLGASGVVAVVAAGMMVNFAAPGRVSPVGMAQLRAAWGLMAYLAGSLIFILAALLIPRLAATLRLSDIGLILVVAFTALIARGVILYGILPALTLARLSRRVEHPYRVAILWGGLRGAVTLALALAVTENIGVPLEVKRMVGVVAVGFTLFTLLVQGTTLRPLIGWLGLDRLSPIERALSDQVVAVALQSVRETVADTTKSLDLQPAIVREEAVRFGARLASAVERADEAQNILDRDRITLGLLALAGHERDLVLEAFRDDLMPARLAERMLAEADRLIEATRSEGRSGYRVQSKRAIGTGKAHRWGAALHTRLGASAPFERLTADQFEHLVAQSQIVRGLHSFIDRRILRIHGRRVSDLLHDLLERRSDDVEKVLEGLRLQFPGYAEKLERRLIRRTSLQQELREYDQLTEDGLIGPELYKTLKAEVEAQRQALAARPKLDLSVQKRDFLKDIPLFAGLPEKDRRRLAAQFHTQYAAPGEVLMEHAQIARGVWFIASGAVEMLQAGQITRMGTGEFFGELGVLLKRTRRARVTAISHCTLLILDQTRFLDLVRQNAALRQAVTERAAKRGATVDPEIFLAASRHPVRPLRWLRAMLGRKG